jgi:predicted methyltransferase
MTEYKKDPLRSRARRDVLRAIGENEIINKLEIVQLTDLSPLTINSILREFRNYKIVTCHAGGLYALSGEGREIYVQLLNDNKYKKQDYNNRFSSRDNEEEERVIHTIYIDEESEED